PPTTTLYPLSLHDALPIFAALTAQASALSRTTRFQDTAVTSAQGLLATYGVLPEKLAAATQASADLAAAIGVGIDQAAQLVGGRSEERRVGNEGRWGGGGG